MKRQQRILEPPKPKRRVAQAEIEAEDFLDGIDPERKRLKQMITVYVRTVGKDDAREWTMRIPAYQRNKKKRSLQDFKADMNEKYWIPGVAVIAFDRKGDLINGQHVLGALEESDLDSIVCLVVVNMHPDAYLGYDLGMRRSLADNLKGETEAPGAVGKVLNVLKQWDQNIYTGKGYMTAREGSIRLAGRRGRELLAKTPGIPAHLFSNPFKTNDGSRSVAAMHAASYRLHQIDLETARKFFHCFTTGENMTSGHPVLALRKRFMNMKENERLRSGPTLALILAAWNLFVAHEKVDKLPFRLGQPFPEISAPLPVPDSPRTNRRVQ